MNNKIKPIGTVLGIVLSVFLISFTVLAWVGPPGAPPICPSGEPGCDAPIHVGSTIQTKSGTLILSDSTRGLEVDYGAVLATVSGNVGIGTAGPNNALHVLRTGFTPATNDLAALRVEGNWGGGIVFSEGANRSSIYSPGGDRLGFAVGGTSSGMNEAMRILADGNVGIGTASPSNKLHVMSGTANTAADSLTVPTAQVTGPNVTGTTSNATFVVATNDALGIGIGGSIGFAGRYSGTAQFTAAQIRGAKESATDGEYGGYLAFGTRAHLTQISEKMRITGAGNVGIGTTSPQAKLHIDGSLLITGEITADNNTLSNCAWTTPTCNNAVTCPAGKIAAGSQRHTGSALCGVDPTRWYEQSVYCCNL